MRSVLLITALVFLAKSNTFKIEQIDGIKGAVKTIHFDSEFNTYIAANVNGSGYFYKVNTEKQIILTQKLEKINDVIVNSKNNVYVFAISSKKNGYYDIKYNNVVWLLKSNSTKVHKLYQWNDNGFNEFKYFIDKEDNIFFSTKTGIEFLRPDENILFPIDDFKEYKFSFPVMDVNGSMYLYVIKMGERVCGFVYKERGSVWECKELDSRVVKIITEPDNLTKKVENIKLTSDIRVTSIGKDYYENVFLTYTQNNAAKIVTEHCFKEKCDFQIPLILNLIY